MDKAKKLEEAAKKSIGCKNITSSARFEIKLLIEDYEYKQKQLELITQELNTLCEMIPMIKEIAEIKGIVMATAISFVAEVGDIRRKKAKKIKFKVNVH